MISTIYEGKVLDWRFKKLTDNVYSFYIDDWYQGQVFKLSKHAWSAVAANPKNALNGIDGFGTRYHAAKYILEANGVEK